MVPDYSLQISFQRRVEARPDLVYRKTLQSYLNCNKYTIANQDRVHVVSSSGKHRHMKFIGLQGCHNLWACPVCAPRMLMMYRLKLNYVIKQAEKQGNECYLVTFTLPHYKDESADTVITHLLEARLKFQAWLRDKVYRGEIPYYVGNVTATECKYSETYGFHFHQHALFIIPKNNVEDFFAAKPLMQAKWINLTQKYGRGGSWYNNKSIPLYFSAEQTRNADYLVKEMCKTGNGKNLSRDMFDLLKSGNDDDLTKFCEFASAVKGHHRISVSCQLYARLGLDREKITLEAMREAALGEFDTSARVVCSFTAMNWREILEAEYTDRKEHRRFILLRAQLDGIDGVRRYCWENGLPQPFIENVRFVFTNTERKEYECLA